MNTLMLYDSTFGNTGQIALALAGRLGDYGTVKLFRVHELGIPHVQDVDLVIIGGPTHDHGLSTEMHAFFERLPQGIFQNLSAVAFDTRYPVPVQQSGSAAPEIAQRLQQMGGTLLVPPRSFFVDEKEGPIEEKEVRDATHWAEQIVQTFEAQKGMARSV